MELKENFIHVFLGFGKMTAHKLILLCLTVSIITLIRGMEGNDFPEGIGGELSLIVHGENNLLCGGVGNVEDLNKDALLMTKVHGQYIALLMKGGFMLQQ